MRSRIQHKYTHTYIHLHIGYVCVSGRVGGHVMLLKSG